MDSSQKVLEFLGTEAPTGPWKRPQSLAEVDVSQGVLEDLALKILYLSGSISILDLSDRTRLSFEVANELFTRLRTEHLCQVTGMTANIPCIAITSQGRTRAMELLAQSQYSGPAPVTLASYVREGRRQSVRNVRVHPDSVERAFAHLVINPKTLRQVGTALNSGAAIFLYGPSGTGKTTIAETLSRVMALDEAWIPYAVEADGQIITVFDAAIHKPIDTPEFAQGDGRWVRCHRPTVLVGGELTVEMLDLQFNPNSRFYVGPVQMKANNGVLIIDDFGRQRVRPAELLNRWVVPLDRGIDFLTLAGGKKIEIPFEMLVVFASNMDPYELVDEAFLRRIKTRILIGPVPDEEFREIFRRVASEHEVESDPGVCDDLIRFIRDDLKHDLRPCYPRDIVSQVCWAAQYDGTIPYLDKEALTRAIEAYFLAPKASSISADGAGRPMSIQ